MRLIDSDLDAGKMLIWCSYPFKDETSVECWCSFLIKWIPWLHIASLMTFYVPINMTNQSGSPDIHQGCVDTSDSRFSMFQWFFLAKPHYSRWNLHASNMFAVAAVAVAVAVAAAAGGVVVVEIQVKVTWNVKQTKKTLTAAIHQPSKCSSQRCPSTQDSAASMRRWALLEPRASVASKSVKPRSLRSR